MKSVAQYFKIRSFRIRIMLLSVIVPGIVLVLFGVSGWMLIYQNGLDSMDSNIREMGFRELSSDHLVEHWENLDQALQFICGKKPGSAVIQVKNFKNEIIYQSASWPAEIDLDDIRKTGVLDTSVYQLELKVPPPIDRPPPPRGGERQEPESSLPRNDFLSKSDGGRPVPLSRENHAPRRDGNPPPSSIQLHASKSATITAATRRWRICAIENQDTRMIAAVNLQDLEDQVDQIRKTYMTILPAALLLIGCGGWLISRRALKSITAFTQTVDAITVEGLDRRVSTECAESEFAALITVFNRMMDRLQRSFEQAVRFSENAAHELKTPLSILQGELEQAIQSVPDNSHIQQVLVNLLEETARLKSITRKLLFLARADAGHLVINKETVDLGTMLESIGDDLRDMVVNCRVEINLEPNLRIQGDPQLIQQVIQNLADNAMKYNKPEGFIQIGGRRQGNDILLIMSNTSRDIVPEERDKIFQRFYRCQSSLRAKTEGFGLGLAISREIARIHGGDLELVESKNGVTTFCLMLPAG